MARTCTICSHAKLVNIDRQLLRGDMLNGIAHRMFASALAQSPPSGSDVGIQGVNSSDSPSQRPF